MGRADQCKEPGSGYYRFQILETARWRRPLGRRRVGEGGKREAAENPSKEEHQPEEMQWTYWTRKTICMDNADKEAIGAEEERKVVRCKREEG